ncbi:unnamed protein product [Oncorhynchus mykiss]|uniref:Coiled-coil domain-containing protein 169 n=1 Tax=Oncorhynchus mykiss TaxID=8022 RepID=A0A060YJI0_ONCMY|nr:unnamed protein product [Oncorhynchus mykiss]
MGDADFSKYDLARLQDELAQEREMKEMLQESVCDLGSTMTELEERLNSVNLEGNEWKTRYDTQVELNGRLERQIALVHEKMEDLRRNPMDRLASIRSYYEVPVVSSDIYWTVYFMVYYILYIIYCIFYGILYTILYYILYILWYIIYCIL